MSQRQLVKQINTKLRTDTGTGSLVALTCHKSTDLRIIAASPKREDKTPVLLSSIFQSVAINSDITHVQRARVYFLSVARDKLNCIDIADRLELLLKPERTGGNQSYYDFSGGSISNRMSRFRSRDDIDLDEDSEAYSILIEADLIWVDSACS